MGAAYFDTERTVTDSDDNRGGRSKRKTLPGFPAVSAPPPDDLRGKVRFYLRRAEVRAEQSSRRRVRFLLYAIRLGLQLVRQWVRDRCPQQAASLAFQTVLSVVPIMAVCLATLRVTGLIEAESTFVEFLSHRLIPVSEQEIAAKLTEWTENITFQTLGFIGLFSTLFLGFVMWSSLEKTLNHIWRAERKRMLAQKFVVFYATITIGPLLIGSSLYQAAKFGLTEGSSGVLFGIGSSFSALFLVHWFLPATRVRVVPAAVGAAVTTVLFELAKLLFAIYVREFAFQRYSGIYGALAVAPVALIWIYWSWLITLLGAEIAHATQNLRLLEQSERRGTLSLENELLTRVTGPMAARIMVTVCEAFLSGDKVISRQQLADRFDLSPDVVDRITARLKSADLLLEVEGEHTGFLPARAPGTITLAQVLATFRGEDRVAGNHRASPLAVVLADIEAGTNARTANVTFDQLVEPSGRVTRR